MSNFSQSMHRTVLFCLLLLCVIILFGLLGGVHWGIIFKRILFYVPVFGVLVFSLTHLLNKWAGEEEKERNPKDLSNSVSGNKETENNKNQASNLGKSLDIKESSAPFPNSFEVEKAAKVVRQMLAQDKE